MNPNDKQILLQKQQVSCEHKWEIIEPKMVYSVQVHKKCGKCGTYWSEPSWPICKEKNVGNWRKAILLVVWGLFWVGLSCYFWLT
mgnify:CR=1 FL=1